MRLVKGMEINDNVLVRYFLGQCSEREKEEIHRWLESDKANERRFIRERIRFDASLMVDEWTIARSRPHSRIFSLVVRVLRVAAVILFLWTGGNYFYMIYQTDRVGKSALQRMYVPSGNRACVTLPDGTLAWLNSNTSLIYPNIFSGKERTVELDGEAYFEVVEDSRNAFIVKTGEYNVEVLGTSFNVEAYAGKPVFKTALFTGKVKLYKEEKQEETLVYLNAGETVELKGDELIVSTTDFNAYHWRDGLIVIDDSPFEEIMQLLEKYYGQRIVIRNEKVKNLGYRGKLRTADGVDHALRVLQKDFHFVFKREEDTNTIYIY
jgi:ferric-dicitrate binding protein FerR (iron transport regulator)